MIHLIFQIILRENRFCGAHLQRGRWRLREVPQQMSMEEGALRRGGRDPRAPGAWT